MYSYPNLLYKDDSRIKASENIGNKVYFTGEYCHNSDFATIHGAVEHGLNTAQ